MKKIIFNDYIQNIHFGFHEISSKKVLWIIIIIGIKACGAIDTNKK
jgi:hypothetical protein